MSSSCSEHLRLTDGRGLTIPELIKMIGPSCGEILLNVVQSILMDREKEAKVDSENLIEDLQLVREEVRLLESILEKREATDLEVVKELKCSQDKCKELEEIIAKLSEELAKAREENTKILNVENNLILELNKNLEEMKNRNSVSQLLLQEYRQKIQHLDEKVEKMDLEIFDLKIGKSILFDDNMKAGRVIEDLKNIIHEASETENKLRLKILESEKKTEVIKRRLEDMEPRTLRLEKKHAKCSNANLGGVDSMELGLPEKGQSMDFMGSKGGEKASRGTCNALDQVLGTTTIISTRSSEALLASCPGNRSTLLWNGASSDVDESSGGKIAAEKIIEASPVAKLVFTPLGTKQAVRRDTHKAIRVSDLPEVSDCRGSRLIPRDLHSAIPKYESGRPGAEAHKDGDPNGSNPTDIIVIDDVDEEMKPVETAHNFSTSKNGGELNEMMLEASSLAPSSTQTNQGNRCYLKDDRPKGQRKLVSVNSILESTPKTIGGPYRSDTDPHKFIKSTSRGAVCSTKRQYVNDLLRMSRKL